MYNTSSDNILLLKQRLTEQEALIHALQEKLSNREREIDHLQAQQDKLCRKNFGSRPEKVSRRIVQMEADLNRLQKESYLRHVLAVIVDWPVPRVSELLPWRITLPTE